jgi:hypothetical protein
MIRPNRLSLFLKLITLSMVITSLTACGRTANGTTVPAASSGCGNGICNGGENTMSCPSDCPGSSFAGSIKTTLVNSAGIGDIAVMIGTPQAARYPEGAGVVVVVPPIFSPANGFQTDPDLTSIGLIQVSFLWPGQTDPNSRLVSAGNFDYGGDMSTQVLQDVIRFASGQIPDKEGKYLSALVKIKPITSEVGLYAFADAGIAAINTLALKGENLANVQYYIGRENPTVDTLTCLEAGYMNYAGAPVSNPFYTYPTSYSPNAILLDYSNIRWDPKYKDPHSGAVGVAYIDMDSSNTITSGDYVLSWHVPVMFGKRYYSVKLTQALLDNGSLTLSNWPADVATPQEAARDWPARESPSRYITIRSKLPNLKVMLVFAQDDSFQAAADKPHIHQAFQGFRFEAGLWVRLNPDRAYVQSLIPTAGNEFPDNPANTQPADWTQIGANAYPGQGSAAHLVPLAAVAEMADRAHFGRWDENLGQELYIYFPNTPQP